MMDQVSSNPEADLRAEVVWRARDWIGTPYRHQSSLKGAGADCLGLLRGIWREVYGAEPEKVPSYTPDWAEPSGEEVLLAAAARNLIDVARADARDGDVVVMRMQDSAVAKHVGILARDRQGYATLIHAYSGHGVVESPLGPSWARRIAGVFRFPERAD